MKYINIYTILFCMLTLMACNQNKQEKAELYPEVSVSNSKMTQEVARFIVSTELTDISDDAYEHAKIAMLDWLGVTLAGASDPLVKKLVDFSSSLGGKPQSSVLGYNIKMSVTQAALINGSASHALDFDDSHNVFRGHPSTSIIATIMALAELEQKSGKELLAAYLVGLDVGVALAKCGANEIYARGMHNTSTLGIIASAAAASHLLDLNEEQTINALAIATTQAFGLKRSFGTMTKPLHSGLAAEGATKAALLARDGFTGADDIFEAPYGFFDVFVGSVNPEVLSAMGKDWGLTDLSVKYHASCHWTHGAIETLIQIAERDGVTHDDIQSIIITVTPIALKTASIIQPKTGLEGKFSIPYTSINAIVTGKTGMQGFTEEAVKNKEIAALIEKTQIVEKENDDWFYTETTIKTNNGETYTANASVMQNLPGLEEKRIGVKKKYTELVEPILGKEKTIQIEQMILSLDSIDDMSDFNKSTGLQYIRELIINVVEESLSGYEPEVWE